MAGSSYNVFSDEIRRHVLATFKPEATILDVGPGRGKYSDLLRGTYPNMDCCEIFPAYVDKYNLREKYRKVHVLDICDLRFRWYDLIIMGDVLEHITVRQAQLLLARLKSKCRETIIIVPYASVQGAIADNDHERHLQPDLTQEVVAERYPDLTLVQTATIKTKHYDKYTKAWYILKGV